MKSNRTSMDSAAEYVSSPEFPVAIMQILAQRLAGRLSETEAESLAMDIAEDVIGYVELATEPRLAA